MKISSIAALATSRLRVSWSKLTGKKMSRTKPTEEIEYWKNEIVDAPDDADNYNQLANVYADVGMYDEAIDAYKTAIGLQSDNPYFSYNLGLVYKQAGMHDAAESVFQDLIDGCPPDMKDFISAARSEIESISKLRG